MSFMLQVPGIQGETSDKNHQGYIDLIEAKFSTSRKITSATSTRGDRESSNTSISNLYFMKFMDKSSPHLFIQSCCGTGQTLILVGTKTGAGNGTDVFIEYTLENALFSKMKVEASNQSYYRPVEEYEVSFTKLSKKYIPYDEDGKAEAAIIVGFDTATNTKL